MDFERGQQILAKAAATFAEAGIEPVFVPPRQVTRAVAAVKSDNRVVRKLVAGRGLTHAELVLLKSAMLNGYADEYGGQPMLRWVTKTLHRIDRRTPVGIDGEPITWAEATAIDHPFMVAVKAFTDPSHAHLKADARRYVAASPLREPLRAATALPGERVTTRPDGEQTGALVALIPSDADIARLAALGTEKPEDLHVTLYYPGQAHELDSDGYSNLLPRIRALAALHKPVQARVAGMATFNPTGDEPAHVLILNDPGIEHIHQGASNIVENTLAAELVDQHKPYIPHVTLGYGGTQPQVPNEVFTKPLTLDKIRLGWGSFDHDIPLTGTQ